MTRSLGHRGPDGVGHAIRGQVALGHRRLCILDPSSRAAQPMQDASGSAWITFNGEIYNFRELAASLAAGSELPPTSDTEVLLRALVQRSPRCLEDVSGIFAFAFLDESAGKLTIARDPFGVKPLYYAVDGDRLYFASEVKALLAAGVEAGHDPLAMLEVVFTGWTADRRTIFRGVERLPPGHVLTLDLGSKRHAVTRYYEPRPDWGRAARLGSAPEAWERAVEAELERATREQLVSDVPVGAFCSGGVDSGLLSAIAARHLPSLEVFNVSFPGFPALDEGPYARRIADHLKVPLHTLAIDRDGFRRALAYTVWMVESPLTFVNTVPLYLVSRLARERGMRVMLSGEGADECWGGYVGLFRRNALGRTLRARGGALGGAVFDGAVRVADWLAPRLGFQRSGDPADVPAMHEVLIGGGLLSWTLRRKASEVYARVPDPLDRELEAELLRELQTYLLPILHRTDRAAMAAGIEARVPYLDPALVSLALAAPAGLKVGVRRWRPDGKAILKRIAARHLPADVVRRRKVGFEVPRSFYAGPWPERWLRDSFVAEAYRLDAEDLRAWIDAQPGQVACWMLTLEMWGRLFVRGCSLEQVEAEFAGSERPARAGARIGAAATSGSLHST